MHIHVRAKVLRDESPTSDIPCADIHFMCMYIHRCFYASYIYIFICTFI